jgi:hypothetical protein
VVGHLIPPEDFRRARIDLRRAQPFAPRMGAAQNAFASICGLRAEANLKIDPMAQRIGVGWSVGAGQKSCAWHNMNEILADPSG